MKLYLGSDHAGFTLRTELANMFLSEGHDVKEFGATSLERYDYPVAADEVAKAMKSEHDAIGILVCGSGVGVSIRANRYRHLRAANCCSVEMAKLAREHNHANVLCLGERLISIALGLEIARTFCKTPFDETERHARRVLMLGAEPEC